MSGTRLPDRLVKLIYEQHDAGQSTRAIAANLHISQFGVRAALRRRVAHSSQQLKVQLGRPRSTSTKTDQAIVLAIKRNRFATNDYISASFHVSRETIRRRGLQYGIVSRVAHRDVLKRHHKTARRRWCLQHLRTNFQSWIFSDESAFQLQDCSAPLRMLVHRGKNERYAAACTLPNPVYDRRTCMVWGCITASGRGPLAFVDGSIDSNKYISILQQHLIPFIDDMPLSRSMQTVFQ
jgi:hypothetical protein